jgi:hypothetical protein
MIVLIKIPLIFASEISFGFACQYGESTDVATARKF